MRYLAFIYFCFALFVFPSFTLFFTLKMTSLTYIIFSFFRKSWVINSELHFLRPSRFLIKIKFLSEENKHIK